MLHLNRKNDLKRTTVRHLVCECEENNLYS